MLPTMHIYHHIRAVCQGVSFGEIPCNASVPFQATFDQITGEWLGIWVLGVLLGA